jgi:glucose/arabinose dehydrogenase
MARLLIPFALAVMMATGCSDSPPASPAPPAGGGETISGSERVGWVQPASSATELAMYQYAIYVDSIRRLLDNSACMATANAGGFACSAPLPALTPGRHTLELAAFIIADGGSVVEGPRSAPLHVTVVATTAPAGSVLARSVTTPEGLTLEVAILADDLLEPIDLAVTGDRRVLVAERAGRIRLFATTGKPDRERAGENVLDLFRHGDEAELLSVALPPDFDNTGRVYLAMSTPGRDESLLHITRVRAARDVMGEAAVLSTHQIPPETTAVVRFGPDRHLYVGVGTGTQPNEAQRLSAAAGKILRLREDGGTPDGNPWNSPVWSAGHRDPRGLAWQTGSQTLWEVERDEQGDELNAIRAGANHGWPNVRGAQTSPHVTRPSFILPAGTEPSGITTVPLPTSPFADSLIVSARAGQDLLRVRLDSSRRQQSTSPILQGRFGRIAQVAGAADGALYFITANADEWGAGRDLLIRLSPVATIRLPSP